jgi:uncharacterized protein YpuA (DUF1002 family)
MTNLGVLLSDHNRAKESRSRMVDSLDQQAVDDSPDQQAVVDLTPPPTPAPTNVPLTDTQKLQIMGINRKILLKQAAIVQFTKEVGQLQQAQNQIVDNVVKANGIDGTTHMLNEDLDLVPLPR